MSKFPFVKRTIVFVLCAALLLTGNLSTMATEIGALLTETTETIETVKGETIEATEAESESVTEPETESGSGTESVSETESESETEGVPETESESETESVLETESESETESIPETEKEPGTETESKKAEEDDQAEVKMVEYTCENAEATITVSAEFGVLPAEAKLHVLPITSGDEYLKVKSQLESDAKENVYDIAGFLAYDICFLVDGEEIEPNGMVTVVIDYKEAVLPESVKHAEKTSVSVMHLEENNEQIEVRNLSVNSNVSVTENHEVEKIAFTTGSFSTFVIAWKNSAQINVFYVDEETGEEISGSQSTTVSISANETIPFSRYAGNIAGYEYIGARLNNSWNGDEVSSVKATQESESFLWWTSTRYYLTFYHGDDEILKTEYESNVYLIYKDVSNQIETIDTSKEITIDVFDYKANTAGNADEAVASVGAYEDGYGINTNHYLKFMKDAQDGSPGQNCWKSGYGACQGVVANVLGTDGYPKLSSWGENESLSYLFDEQDIVDVKKSYLNANHLFAMDENGYYFYDSDQNYATLAGNEENNFTVYNTPKEGFFPFTTFENASLGCNTTGVGDVLGGDGVNHYFGMTVETDFVQPESGEIDGNPMKFEFSGDDDVWVFIDNVLVLDIGGIHGKVTGSINFVDGTVIVSNADNVSGTGNREVTTSIRELFENAGIVIDDNQFRGNTFADNTTHTMKFFYLERGNHESNCMLKFNLQTLPKGSLYVSKTAIGVAEEDEADYEFRITDENGTAVKNASYTVNGDSEVKYTDGNGVFSLKNGQYAIITELDAGNYTVTETAVKNSANNYHIRNFHTNIYVNGINTDSYNADTAEERNVSVSISDAVSTRTEFKNLYTSEVTTSDQESYSKVIAYNEEEDNYDLTLSFKGPKEETIKTEYEDITTENTAKADIILVMDMSGSMKGTNLSNSQKAVTNMVNALEEKKSTVDARWKLVTFSETAHIETSSWITGMELNNIINSYTDQDANGGTNYQDGLVKAQSVVQTAREDADKIVIFLTDGEPTWHLCENHDSFYTKCSANRGNCEHTEYLNNSGNACRGGGSSTRETDYLGALMGAETINCDTFYAVGIGLTSNSGYKNKSGLEIITDVKNKVSAKTASAVNKQPSELGSLFADMAGEIITECESHITKTYKYASNVTITDTLSQYADIVEGSIYAIHVVNEEGSEVGISVSGTIGVSNATYTIADEEGQIVLAASYDSGQRSITLDFPDEYILDDSYTYSVTFKVKASAKAYEEFFDGNNSYGDTRGDDKTDAEGNYTSSNQPGFYSNENAEVTYTFGDDSSESRSYLHPVIQVKNASKLILTKTDDANTKVLENAEFGLYKKNASGEFVKMSIVYKTNREGQIDFGFLKPGEYRLAEENAPATYKKTEETLTFTVRDGRIVDFATSDPNSAVWTIPAETPEPSEVNGLQVYTYQVSVKNEKAIEYLWNLVKVSESSFDHRLSGAKFVLEGSDTTYYGISGEDGVVGWYTDNQFENPASEIASGVYTLREMSAPAGYAKSPVTMNIEVDEENNIQIDGMEVVNNPKAGIYKNSTIDNATNVETITYEIYFANEAIYTLPETGGTGIFAYIFGGMFLLMTGILYIFAGRRKACRL